MIDLLEITEIMDDVRLNNDCGLVGNILNLTKEGIEIGYECGSLKISRHITHVELDYLHHTMDTIECICDDMLLALRAETTQG